MTCSWEGDGRYCEGQDYLKGGSGGCIIKIHCKHEWNFQEVKKKKNHSILKNDEDALCPTGANIWPRFSSLSKNK